jgi:hypothetical protein
MISARFEELIKLLILLLFIDSIKHLLAKRGKRGFSFQGLV